MDTKERAAQLLDDLKREARGPAETPEPTDEELVTRAGCYLTNMPAVDLGALVQTYPAFRILFEALARHHAGQSDAHREVASSQVVADLVSAPRGPEAAAVLWLCRVLRTPTRKAAAEEIERWVDCLQSMSPTDVQAFLKDHPHLRGPVTDAAVRRMRSRVYDSALPAHVRAAAAALLVQLGIDAGPRGAH